MQGDAIMKNMQLCIFFCYLLVNSKTKRIYFHCSRFILVKKNIYINIFIRICYFKKFGHLATSYCVCLIQNDFLYIFIAILFLVFNFNKFKLNLTRHQSIKLLFTIFSIFSQTLAPQKFTRTKVFFIFFRIKVI